MPKPKHKQHTMVKHDIAIDQKKHPRSHSTYFDRIVKHGKKVQMPAKVYKLG